MIDIIVLSWAMQQAAVDGSVNLLYAATVAMTFIRNALVRGYAILKIPSNELGAAVAFGKTMIDMAPDHPLTRNWSAAYWKGGDETFEREIYHPKNVDRIVAWGGFESVRHIAKYVRPVMV